MEKNEKLAKTSYMPSIIAHFDFKVPKLKNVAVIDI